MIAARLPRRAGIPNPRARPAVGATSASLGLAPTTTTHASFCWRTTYGPMGGLGDEIWNIAATQRALSGGRMKVEEHNSPFGPRCASYVDSALRPHAEARRGPTELASERVLAKFARLQTVKCSPFRPELDDAPNDVMGHNSPSGYLMHELALLEPRLLIALGDRATDRLRTFARFSLANWSSTTVDLGWGPIRVVSVYHPSSSYFSRGLQILSTAL
jgi:hypothetical protein